MPMKITSKVKKALVKKMTKDMVTTVIKKGLDMVMVDTDRVILMDIKEAITDHKRVT